MKHTKTQSTRAKNNLIKHFQYKESDFYLDGGIWRCANSEDVEESCFDVYNDKISSNPYCQQLSCDRTCPYCSNYEK